MAMTLDGKVVTGNPKAGFILSGSAGDRRGMAELRARADAVMMGAGTLRAENPVMKIAGEDLIERRRRKGKPDNPRYLVVTNSGKVDPDARMFSQPGAMVVTSEAGAEAISPELGEKADVLAAGVSEVDLALAAQKLKSDYAVHYLLIEGGPTLTHSALAAGIVDEFFVTLAPLVKSGKNIPALVDGPAFPFGELPRVELLSMAEDNSELYLRYRVMKP
jgi:riboflavin-specific deaminase-like protein